MKMKIYNIGCTDFFGSDNPSDKVNKKLIPLLKKLGIKKEKDLDSVMEVIQDICEDCYHNGTDNERKESGEYDYED